MLLSDYEIFLYGGSGKDNPAYRYRVQHLKEQLDLLNIKNVILDSLSELLEIKKLKNKILILHRVAWDSEVSKVVDFAKNKLIPVVYDIDDYVFEPNIISTIRGVDLLSDEEKVEYEKTVSRYRKTLQNCDFAISSTDYLKERIEELGVTAFTHRNCLPSDVVQISDDVRKSKKQHHDDIVIGYFSGTHTHNFDFEECSSVLHSILKEFKNVKLLIVGPLDLPSSFDKFSNRIEQVNLVDWKKLPSLISSVDINIASLESDNKFSLAKSELKYFEAAIVNVPTIASNTESYSYAITNFENGFIASNKKDWYKFLKKLITDENLRIRISSNALNDTFQRYTNTSRCIDTKNLLKNIIKLYEKNNKHFKSDMLKKVSLEEKIQLNITWILPPLAPFQGGLRNILSNCHHLSNFGHHIIVHLEPSEKFQNETQVKNFIEKYYCEPNFSIKLNFDIQPCDLLIATFWPTAYLVNEITHVKNKVYFVQDYEPYFYQMGLEYIMCENSYQFGFNHITVFPWLTPLLKKRFNAKADYILPAINTNVYFSQETKSNKFQIIFYGRPDQPRRCYQLGIDTLSLVYQQNNDVEIIIFGSDKLDTKNIPFPHKNLEVLHEKELAKLYQNSNLGVVFNTTNPSLVSFEMMACGCPVIDLNIESNHFNYDSEKNVVLANPTARDLSKKILNLINDKKTLDELSKNGMKFIKKFPNEEQSSQQLELLFIKIFKNQFPESYDIVENNFNERTKTSKELSNLENRSNEELLKILLKSIYSKYDELENQINTLTDSFISTKNQLNKLDNNVYQISKKFPINLAIKFLKR